MTNTTDTALPVLNNIAETLVECQNKLVKIIKKIGTHSVHLGSLSEVSRDTPNYNYTLLRIVTMLNTMYDRYFAGYAQALANFK